MNELMHVVAVFGVFVAIIVGAAVIILGLAYAWGRAIDEESPLTLDPTEESETVRVLPRIDFNLSESPGDQ